MTLMTFVTRTCGRPHMLLKNIDSLLMQTDKDWEQVILIDDDKRGMRFAQQMLIHNKSRVRGEYVYVFDDDHRLITPAFVSGIRTIVAASKPDVIIVKCKIRGHDILPHPWMGNGGYLKGAHVDTGCFVVEGKAWGNYVYAFNYPDTGDWHFYDKLWRSEDNLKIVWWDKVVAEDMREFMEWG